MTRQIDRVCMAQRVSAKERVAAQIGGYLHARSRSSASNGS
jgi:hypothetical protein